MQFLDKSKVIAMIDYLIEEPGFDDSADRCFKLPFIACEVFTFENAPVKRALFNDEDIDEEAKDNQRPQYFEVWDKIFSFFKLVERGANSTGEGLNVTLGGYINKVVSYWLIKRP